MCIAVLVASLALPDCAGAGAVYTSPRDGAAYVLRESNIVVRSAEPLSEGSLGAWDALSVTGSESGPITGRRRLARDHRTILFEPDQRFEPNERVTVRVAPGVVTGADGGIEGFAFAFDVTGPARDLLRAWRPPPEEGGAPPADGALAGSAIVAAPLATAEPLPDDYPVAAATTTGPTAPGRIFLTSLVGRDGSDPGYILEIENDGLPFFLRRLPGGSVDFKQQPNGRLTYFDEAAGCFYALDESYAVVDSFRTGNGYVTDHHDLQLLPNGHALLMAYDPQIVDLTVIDPKLRPDATVVGLVIQELDASKDVVFQWRSWDHFRITDAVGVLLGAGVVDYVHGNSVEATPDGHILISSRHLEEITKIDRETGEILWRLGGRNNQFAFVGDPVRFSRQHDARILPNGNLTLFDNGNRNVPRVSRALEYELDERRMTATLVWQFRRTPDVFSPAMGSMQRLPNGNTVIGWGFDGPAYTEVTPRGEVVQEVFLREGARSYRAFRFERPAPLSATLAITPRVLNTESSGPATVAIGSTAFAAADIDRATVTLNGSLLLEPASAAYGDTDADGVADGEFRFDRASLMPLLTPGSNALDVAGSLRSGERFRGYANVNVVPPDVAMPAGSLSRLLSRPGTLPVVLALDQGLADQATSSRSVRIFDARGRLVVRPRLGADGARRWVWDGRGADGRPVPAGVYFVRIGDAVAGPARKIVIVR